MTPLCVTVSERLVALLIILAFCLCLTFRVDGQIELKINEPELLKFEQNRIAVRETDGSLLLNLNPTELLADAITFGVAIAPLDGGNSEAIIPEFSQVRVEPNQGSVPLRLLIMDNNMKTGPKSYAVHLFPINFEEKTGLVGLSRAVISIIDDEQFISAQLEDLEAFESQRRVDLTIQLEKPAERDSKASIKLYSGSALESVDFSGAEAEVVIGSGVEEANLTIYILDDALFEAHEHFFARVINSDGLKFTDAEAKITIVDDDKLPVATVVTEQVNEDAAKGTISVTLDKPAGVETSVFYTLESDTAIANQDFVPISGLLVFPAGITEQTLSYELVDDLHDELDEKFTFALSDPTGLVLNTARFSIDLIDNDPRPLVILDESDLQEGKETPLMFRLSQASDLPISFGIRLVGGTANIPEDVAPIDLLVSFKPGETENNTLNIYPVIDEIYEGEETINLQFFNAENVNLPSRSLELGITDNQSEPSLRLASFMSREGGNTNSLTLELSHPSSSISNFTLQTQSGDARAGDDFTVLNQVYSFGIGQTALTIPLKIVDNELNEAVETFRILISNPSGLKILQNTYEIDIEDDDPEPSLEIRGSTQISENSEQGLAIEFILSSLSGREVSFDSNIFSAHSNGYVERDIEPYDSKITILPGTQSAILRVRPTADFLFEDTEEFGISLAEGVGVSLPSEPFIFEILDNDAPPLADLFTPELSEGEADLTALSVQLSKPAGKDTPLKIGVFEGSAREGQDYEFDALDLLIPEGSSWVPVEIRPVDDDIYEEMETFEVAIVSIDGATTDQPVKQVRIFDNDPQPTVHLSRRDLSENNAYRSLVEFSLSGPSGQPVILDLGTQSGTAVLGQDYLTDSGVVEFEAGQTLQTLDLQIIDDEIYEGVQSLTLQLEDIKGGGLDDPGAALSASGLAYWDLTIEDNDQEPRLLTDQKILIESDSNTLNQLAFELDRPAELPVQFDYALNDSLAVEGDILLPSGTLQFPPGQRRQTVSVQIVDDQVNEPDERINLRLLNPINVRLPDEPYGILIIDDDPLPTLSISGGRSTESDEEVSISGVPFILALDSPSDQTVHITLGARAHLTGTNPAEFGLDIYNYTTDLSLKPGQTQASVLVPIRDDSLHELPESFYLSILSADGARIETGDAVGFIDDNDPPPLWSVQGRSILESNVEDSFVSLQINKPSGKDAYVDYKLEGQTAKSGLDFEPLYGTAFIPAGQTEIRVKISLIDDQLDEASETFNIVLSNPTHSALGDQVAQIKLLDDDVGPLLSYQAVAFLEGGGETQNRVVFTLSEASAYPLELEWRAESGTALANRDYIAESGHLIFEPGQLQAHLDLQIIDDDIDEPLQNFFLLMSSDHIRIDPQPIELEIKDNDPAPDLTMSETWVDEASKTTEVLLELMAPSERDLSGSVENFSLSAQSGIDYSFPTQDFTFISGETDLRFPVQIFDDKIDEIDERFDLEFQLNVDDAGQSTRATVHIQDNDSVPALEVENIRVGEGSGIALIPVRLSGPSGKTISFTYSPIAASAKPDEDYVSGLYTHILPAGTTESIASLPLINDSIDEVSENFNLVIQSVTNSAIAVGLAEITIDDDDPPVFARLSAGSVSESGQLRVLAELGEPSSQTIELAIESVSGSAVAGQDYIPFSKTVIIEAGEKTAEVYVDPIDDNFQEGDETFWIRVSKARNAQFDPEPILVTIEDNDTQSRLSVHAQKMVEGQTGEFIFTLSEASDQIIVAEFTLIDGTAVRNVDYALNPGFVVFQPGEVQKTIFVPVRADRTDEFDETFSLSILASTVPVEVSEVFVTLVDQDPTPDLEISVPSVYEADGEMSVQVSLSSLSEKTISTTVGVNLSGAVFSPSFVPENLEFVLEPGREAQTLYITINDDIFDEVDESVSFDILEIENAHAPRDSLSTYVLDDDEPSAIDFVDFALNEGSPGDIFLPLRLDKPSGKLIQFSYNFEDGSAMEGIDWRASGQSIVIEPGQSEVDLPFTLLDDSLYEGDETFSLVLGGMSEVFAPEMVKTLSN